MTYLLINKTSGGIYGWYKSKDEAQNQLDSMANKEDWFIK